MRNGCGSARKAVSACSQCLAKVRRDAWSILHGKNAELLDVRTPANEMRLSAVGATENLWGRPQGEM